MAGVRGPYERVPGEPFVAWFRRFCERNNFNQKAGAKWLGIDPNQVHRAEVEGTISVITVDRAMLHAETNISELYPDLFC